MVNTTFFLTPAHEKAFLHWVWHDYAPALKRAGACSVRLFKLSQPPAEGAIGYAVQTDAPAGSEAELFALGGEAETLRSGFCAASPQELLYFTSHMAEMSPESDPAACDAP